MRTWLESLEAAAYDGLDPDVVFYLRRGCGDDVAVREATGSWGTHRWLPRVLRDASQIDLSVRLFGDWRTPVGVAPTAFHALLHDEGEVATARGAAAAGAPFVLSSRATRRIEDVAAAIDGPWWFQVYLMHDRSLTRAMVARAAAAGATALVLTGDTPYVGYRSRTGQARPLSISDELALANLGEHLGDEAQGDPWLRIDQDPDQALEDIDWLVSISDLPVIVKGVLHPQDAVECVDHGAAGVWVSNHGGRQFDRAAAPTQALAAVVDAVGADVPVVVDGGIRDGLDAMTALALGASLAFVGRPAMWGLRAGAGGAGGADGVTEVLTELAQDVAHWMGCAGAGCVEDLDASYLLR